MRSADFMRIVAEALRYRSWRAEAASRRFAPLLNGDAAQPGMLVELVVLKTSAVS